MNKDAELDVNPDKLIESLDGLSKAITQLEAAVHWLNREYEALPDEVKRLLKERGFRMEIGVAMNEETSRIITCPHCRASFKVTVREDAAAPRSLTCPSCQETSPTPGGDPRRQAPGQGREQRPL